mgnify:CR=1 FL=1
MADKIVLTEEAARRTAEVVRYVESQPRGPKPEARRTRTIDGGGGGIGDVTRTQRGAVNLSPDEPQMMGRGDKVFDAVIFSVADTPAEVVAGHPRLYGSSLAENGWDNALVIESSQPDGFTFVTVKMTSLLLSNQDGINVAVADAGCILTSPEGGGMLFVDNDTSILAAINPVGDVPITPSPGFQAASMGSDFVLASNGFGIGGVAGVTGENNVLSARGGLVTSITPGTFFFIQ